MNYIEPVLLLDERALSVCRNRASKFLDSVSIGSIDARLTSHAEATPFALCFRVFLTHLLGQHETLQISNVATALRNNVRQERKRRTQVPQDKPYRQLLTFTLSALAAIQQLEADPLEELVVEQLSPQVGRLMTSLGCLEGVAGAGNQAMFTAIFLLHAKQYLSINVDAQINEWIDCHLKEMNVRGFWSKRQGITHLEFQNGYHQHEILEFLSVENPYESASIEAVMTLADTEGHFAPYPGGGGCHDYDAIFMLTSGKSTQNQNVQKILHQTALTLLATQNDDGGFCESHYIRPRTLRSLWRFTKHILYSPNLDALLERTRYAATLQRPKHNKIHTHWSEYSRRWNESDLWDTWFRLMTLARIDVFFSPERANSWGFINYPGIGFHPALYKTSEHSA